jgi:hypothetical protein
MDNQHLKRVEELCLEAHTEMVQHIKDAGNRHPKLLTYWSILELIEAAVSKLNQLHEESVTQNNETAS